MLLGLALFFSSCRGDSPAESEEVAPAESVSVESSDAPEEEEAPFFLYGRSFLDGEEQAVYDQLCAAAESVDLEARIPYPYDGERAKAVSRYFRCDNPRFYWAEAVYDPGEGAFHLEIPRGYSVEEVRERDREIRENTALLLEQIEGEGIEWVYSAHDRLARYIAYSHTFFPDDADTLYGGLVNGSAVCEGYTRSLQYILQQGGYPCVYMAGTGLSGVPHSWNAVSVEGEWYYIDLTKDDDGNFLRRHYLCISEEESERVHIWDAAQYPEPPPVGTQRFNYYIYNGFIAENASRQQTIDRLGEVFAGQLAAKAPEEAEDWGVNLEVKVVGSEEDYRAVKVLFLEDTFSILDALEKELGTLRPDLRVLREKGVQCLFNDDVQVLIFLPLVENKQ